MIYKTLLQCGICKRERFLPILFISNVENYESAAFFGTETIDKFIGERVSLNETFFARHTDNTIPDETTEAWQESKQ